MYKIQKKTYLDVKINFNVCTVYSGFIIIFISKRVVTITKKISVEFKMSGEIDSDGTDQSGLPVQVGRVKSKDFIHGGGGGEVHATIS